MNFVKAIFVIGLWLWVGEMEWCRDEDDDILTAKNEQVLKFSVSYLKWEYICTEHTQISSLRL